MRQGDPPGRQTNWIHFQEGNWTTKQDQTKPTSEYCLVPRQLHPTGTKGAHALIQKGVHSNGERYHQSQNISSLTHSALRAVRCHHVLHIYAVSLRTSSDLRGSTSRYQTIQHPSLLLRSTILQDLWCGSRHCCWILRSHQINDCNWDTILPFSIII